MKAILLFDDNTKVVADIVRPLPRKPREGQAEYEARFIRNINESQPMAAHKVVGAHITRV